MKRENIITENRNYCGEIRSRFNGIWPRTENLFLRRLNKEKPRRHKSRLFSDHDAYGDKTIHLLLRKCFPGKEIGK